jgi:acyl-coenzyme A thioesterase PaaI-like protein
MSMELADDRMCYGCGILNEHGLKMKFEHPRKGLLRSTILFGKQHQGFKDIVHGGMIGLVLDEMMVNLAWKDGMPAVTAELTVRLKKATPVGQKVLLEAQIDREEPRALYARATDKNESGELLASATAACIRIKNASIKI